MTRTIVDRSDKSIRIQNWYTILENEPDLLELLLDFNDTADEITASDAAMEVIMALDGGS
jgi:hypothetical protein